MFLKSIATSLLLAALALPTISFSQSNSGNASRVLDHNYKNPGIRTAGVATGHVVKVYNHNVIAQRGQFERGRKHATPKYASQPVSLVIYTRSRKEKVEINPLLSAHHYKASASSHVRSGEPEWISGNI